jgi:hypothetical protein
MTLPGVLLFVGMLLVFVGEQIIGEGTFRWVLDGLGALTLAASVGLRVPKLRHDDTSIRKGAKLGLIFSGVAIGSLLLYAVGTNDISDMLGFVDEGKVRWAGVWRTLFPIVLIASALPMFFIDMVLQANPEVLPRDAAKRAMFSGVSAALAVALIFPVNYLADYITDQYDMSWDTAYFRTTRPGEATVNLAQSLTKPVKILLFFPAGNDVDEEMRPYFDQLTEASGGTVTVERHDQALSIALAEELKLNDNGWVVFQEESEPVKFKMKLELNRAKRDLKKLDSLVQKNLLKATRGQRVAYMITGHGEASHRTKDNNWRKLSKLKKLMQNQSYKLKDLGLVQGLADGVPDDADLLVLAGPMQALLDEEAAAINTWTTAGGQLMVLVDAEADAPTNILEPLGLTATPGRIADPKKRYPGKSPYLIITDRYGTHPAIETLSKARVGIVLPAPIGFSEIPSAPGKRTVLVRSYGSAFADANKNGTQDAGEKTRVQNISYAIEGGEGENAWRAVVIGNVSFVSDNAVEGGWSNNAVLFVDAVRWLAGEEALAGETNSEEDVKIDHTPEGQVWWFWGTIFAVPLLVLGAGIVRVYGRRRKS